MSGYERNDERVSDVLSQETIDKAIRDDAARRAGSVGQQYAQHSQQSGGQHQHASSYEPDRPGISRRETSSRRDPLTGDLIEEYSGNDPNGPGMRAHYNWDEPGKAPSNMPQSQQVYSSGGSSQPPRPGQIGRTNTTVSYTASGDRVEEHDGEGSLQVRALYNEDDDPSTTYRPQGPARHQSERGPSGYQH